jgi:hypothetical protein
MIDTSLLGEMSRDYWLADRHYMVRETVDGLAAANWYIGLTFSHVTELIRHNDNRIANERLDFLRVLPHVAWIRPYNGNWFPGGIIDVHLRELECHFDTPGLSAELKIDHLRPVLWETGTGAEIIQKDFDGWGPLRSQARRQIQDDIHYASIARSDVGGIRKRRLSEIRKLPIRPKNERAIAAKVFAAELNRQLLDYGDERLTQTSLAARSFTSDVVRRVAEIGRDSDDPTAELLLEHGVEEESLRPSMTMEELALLTVFGEHLKLLAQLLRPPKSLTLREITMDDLPSWLIIRELMRAHWREVRVSGSNLGDSDISGAGLYADICVVDKRTHDYIRQSRQRIPALNMLLDRYKKVSSYQQLIESVRAN